LIPVWSYGQIDLPTFQKETPVLERAINGLLNAVLPDYGLMLPARATLLEGYGLVFVTQITLDRGGNLFYNPPPSEVKANVERRRKDIKQKLPDLLKQKFDDMKAAGDPGSMAVVVYVFNSTP